MEATCPNCNQTNLIYLNNDPIQVLKKGIECAHCSSGINFKIFGNKAMVIKHKPIAKQPKQPKQPKLKVIINKPVYQIRQIHQAIYA